MSTRRLLLVTGSLGLLATAPIRVRAATTEAEGAAYGGTSAGGWACGPRARANYGGLGARVRLSENAAPLGGKGYTGELAAAGEYEAVKIIDCDPTKTGDCVAPPSTLAGGAHARVGHRWTALTLEGGLSAFTAWDKNTDKKQRAFLFPEAELGVNTGKADRAVLGLGTPTVTTLRRPGLYVGFDTELPKVGLETRFGAYRSGPAMEGGPGLRADVGALFPMTQSVKFRVGASAGFSDEGGSGEASAGIRGTL